MDPKLVQKFKMHFVTGHKLNKNSVVKVLEWAIDSVVETT